MSSPYEEYRNTEAWQRIEQAIQDLADNKDIKLTSPIEYVVGYITKQVIEQNNTIGPAENEGEL